MYKITVERGMAKGWPAFIATADLPYPEDRAALWEALQFAQDLGTIDDFTIEEVVADLFDTRSILRQVTDWRTNHWQPREDAATRAECEGVRS